MLKKYTQKALDKYRKIVEEELKRQLRLKPQPTTVSDGSRLEDSIQGRKLRGRDGFGIYMNDYGINVNQGRNPGSLPNPYKIEEWVRYNKDKLDLSTATPSKIKKVAFAIRKSISQNGIRPYRFIDIVFEKIGPAMTKEIEDAYMKDLELEFSKSTPKS